MALLKIEMKLTEWNSKEIQGPLSEELKEYNFLDSQMRKILLNIDLDGGCEAHPYGFKR